MGGDKLRPYEIEASNISRNQIMPVGAGFIPARIGENKKMTEHKKLQPEIRFAGFTDDWEQRKLGECFNERTERSSIGELISVTMNSGVIKASDLDRKDNSSKDKSNYKKVEIGDIAYNSMRMWQGSSGESTFRGILSPAYTVLIPNKDISSTFFSYYFKLERMLEIFKVNSQGLTSDTWNLKYPTIAKIVVSVPTLKEQIQIGNFFKQLDDTIALHQRTLEKYQKLKISYLEKMFPKENELYPELRFPNFTDAWEQRKLGEVVNVLDNLRIPIAASQRLEGVTPYYGANGIQGYIDGFTHDGEFVLVAEDGANDLINYPVQYVSGKVWINNHAHVLQGIKNVANNLFLVYRIKSMDMTKYLVGGGRTKLNASVMKDIELHLPNYAEQTQIGNFFKQLDDTIALHQKELTKYQQIKASCLEKMFVE